MELTSKTYNVCNHKSVGFIRSKRVPTQAYA